MGFFLDPSIMIWLGAILLIGLLSYLWRRFRPQRILLVPSPVVSPAVAAAPSTTAWVAGAVVMQDFRIEKELGRGGMGAVYLVRHTSTNIRFVLKRALHVPLKNRDPLLDEIRSWFSLPPHPHLVACRFFRTLHDELVIAADYVEGGTLSEAIRTRRVHTLPDIIRIAVHAAWGVIAVHAQNLIHRDVKPSNILLSTTGIAKVTDFGLACIQAFRQEGAAENQAPGKIYAAMTRQYCSPEQVAGSTVTRQTDVWSWGLTILEMCAGEAFWSAGEFGTEALAQYLEGLVESPEAIPLPPSVSAVVTRCLKVEPWERWNSLGDAAVTLIKAYEELTGAPFPDSRPAAVLPSCEDRYSMRLTKGDSAAAVAIYEPARALLEKAVLQGHREREKPLAQLLLKKAVAHEVAGDLPGAIAARERAISLLTLPVIGQRQAEEMQLLAEAYRAAAAGQHQAGALQQALELYQLALDSSIQVLLETRTMEAARALAEQSNDLAIVARALGGNRFGVAGLERAISIYRDLGRPDLTQYLADVLMNHAILIAESGDPIAALAEVAEARALLQQTPDDTVRLARLLVNQAHLVTLLGQDTKARALLEEVVRLRRMHAQSQSTQASRQAELELAAACLNLADVDVRQRRFSTALLLYEEAIERYTQAITQEGMLDLRAEAAGAQIRYADALLHSGERAQAEVQYQAARTVLKHEVQRGRADLEALLLWADQRFT